MQELSCSSFFCPYALGTVANKYKVYSGSLLTLYGFWVQKINNERSWSRFNQKPQKHPLLWYFGFKEEMWVWEASQHMLKWSWPGNCILDNVLWPKLCLLRSLRPGWKTFSVHLSSVHYTAHGIIWVLVTMLQRWLVKIKKSALNWIQ